jgi:hypothetical protein
MQAAQKGTRQTAISKWMDDELEKPSPVQSPPALKMSVSPPPKAMAPPTSALNRLAATGTRVWKQVKDLSAAATERLVKFRKQVKKAMKSEKRIERKIAESHERMAASNANHDERMAIIETKNQEWTAAHKKNIADWDEFKANRKKVIAKQKERDSKLMAEELEKIDVAAAAA